jgi:hypothetical protein
VPDRSLTIGSVVGRDPVALDDDLTTSIELGLGHVRLALDWGLTEPRPGRIDGGVVETVLDVADRIHGAGGTLWLTLLTPSVPTWFDDEGGFTDARTTGTWWPRWVESIAAAVGDRVDGWVPFEAPFAMAERIVPNDPRRHGELVDTLCVAWRDAWRILQGPHPVASSLDVRVVRIPNDDVVAAEFARREEHLRWRTWLRALRDGTITIPGRADRELDDLAGSIDQLGIAASGDGSLDLEALVQRTAEAGPDRPLAVTLRPTGPDRDARAEAVADLTAQTQRLAGSLPIERLTFTDLDAVAHQRR